MKMLGRRSFAIHILSRLHIYPHRLFLLRIGPQKLLEYDEMMALARLSHDDCVLDIGCGAGVQTILLSKKCRYTIGVDISSQAISLARDRAVSSMRQDSVDFVRADISDITFRRGSFDRILSFCVLEHISRFQEVLTKTRDWLTPGGFLVISVDSLAPLGNTEAKRKHQRDHSVMTYFDCDTLESALKDAGYVDIELRPILKSEYATRWFTGVVLAGNSKRSNTLESLLEYRRLRKAEKDAHNATEGIFIVARARAE